jgi:uncharacterized protein with HEPN domain
MRLPTCKTFLVASKKIEAITAATTEQRFLGDEVPPAAILHHLTVIGEAIKRLSPEQFEQAG